MSRKMTKASVQAIMNKRALITGNEKGKVVLTIQGNGKTIDVLDKAGQPVPNTVAADGTILQKRIFNVKANSIIAMSNPANQTLLREGLAAEKAGNADLAHEKFSEYLNNVQVSVGILLPSAVADRLSDGVEIAAKVEKVTTDKGSLLTLDTSSISVVIPEQAASTNFSFPDEDEDAAPEETTPVEGAEQPKGAEALTA